MGIQKPAKHHGTKEVLAHSFKCLLKGAIRLELCSDLVEGGTTPSVGMLEVMKEKTNIPIMVMLRPRAGDFYYSQDELDVMKRDLLALRQAGADGFVLGILNRDGTVNTVQCKELIAMASPLPVTFHRAIDMTSNIMTALEDVIQLDCARVLTSGQATDALQGVSVIKQMIDKADGHRLLVMPGGGINVNNLQKILEISGAREFHGSARETRDSLMTFRPASAVKMGGASESEFCIRVTSATLVRQIVSIATEHWTKE
ncbi:copper homeostasis protein cutC homolog isoform X1 [Octopus bimaculoides]|uniref:copper homeostasis protein cutC homolog isoform X1 n=1 Tax=Octopus bimaculoides TaxID=37653 RepID=UPI0022E1E93D|nr:copper homeostasis protein cutC homolog isoform X1 [Octopus bimaculoides]